MPDVVPEMIQPGLLKMPDPDSTDIA